MKDEHVENSPPSFVPPAVTSRSASGSSTRFHRSSHDARRQFQKADETIPICIVGLPPRICKSGSQHRTFRLRHLHGRVRRQGTLRAAEFDQDEKAQTFTLCRADNLAQFTYSLSRFEKITAARYAGGR